jgi:hypothetical protein
MDLPDGRSFIGTGRRLSYGLRLLQDKGNMIRFVVFSDPDDRFHVVIEFLSAYFENGESRLVSAGAALFLCDYPNNILSNNDLSIPRETFLIPLLNPVISLVFSIV